MKPSVMLDRYVNGEGIVKLSVEHFKHEFFGFEKSFKAFFDKSYDFVKMVTFAIIKFLLLQYIFIHKVYPQQGFEKTVIFLILVIIVFIKTSEKAQL